MPKRAKSPARRKSTTPRRRASTRRSRPTTPTAPAAPDSDSEAEGAPTVLAKPESAAPADTQPSSNGDGGTAAVHDAPTATGKHVGLVGITRDGKRFAVPHVDDTFNMLGRVWEVPTVLAWLGFSVTAAVAAMSSPRWGALHRAWAALGLGHPYVSPVAIIYIAAFWRLMYNGVLGLLLRAQSQRQVVTRWIDRVAAAYAESHQRGHTPSLVPRIVNAMLSTTLNCPHPLLDMPAELNAWVFTRYFVNIVLANDVVGFVGVVLIMCISHGDGSLDFQCNAGLSATLGENRGWCDVSTGVAWMVGIALVIASLWSKKLSHGVVGAFAWFWGDMFFLAKQDLTFDGIFEIVPHPMYTVGYGWMYGTAIFSGSWVVLAMALGSHLSQLMFLAFVETPHIEGLYGSEFSRETKEWKATHTNDNIFVIKSFDMYRASDWSLMLVLVLISGFAFAGVSTGHPVASPSDVVLFTVAARLLGTFVIGYILARQDRTQFWTAHFSSSGLDARQAFDEWKRLYNLISSIMSLSFVLCALRLRSTTFDLTSLMTPMGLTSSFGAVITIGISAWAMMESHAALGDYGWFFGDFFLPNNQGGEYIQKGIYRFLSNPEAVLGNLWMYGLSVLVGSREAFLVAILCHSIHTVLVLVIEEPHKHRMYKRQQRAVPPAKSD